MYSLISCTAIAFLLSFLCTPLVRAWARRRNPESGDSLVPRIGGVAVALAYAASFAVLRFLPVQATGILDREIPLNVHILPAALMMFAVGLAEDVFGLRPWQKLAGQIAAGVAAYYSGIHLSNFAGLQSGPLTGLALTTLWLVLCANSLTLIDGVGGLGAGLGLFAALTTLLAALMGQNVALALLTAPLVGALLGFLRYNFNPASIYLGECGTLLIGFLLGCYGVLWSQKSATLLGMTAPLLALSIPLLDTVLALLRRLLRHQPDFSTDRGHIYHRLLESGFTPRQVVLILYAVCGFGATCSIVVWNHKIGGLLVIFFCLLTWIGIWQLGYPEFGVAGRLVLDGAFRCQINTRIALQEFERKLIAAPAAEDCWTLIKQTCQELGFHHMEMLLAGRLFRHRNGAPASRSWRIRIPISESDYLELTRVFGETAHAAAVEPLAQIVRRVIPPKLAALGHLAPLHEIRAAASSDDPLPAPCLFMNQFFWPDSAATSQLLTDLVSEVVSEGHEVRVICAANRYAGEDSAPPPSFAIQRCRAVPFVQGAAARVLSYFSFLASATAMGLRGPRPHTVVTLTTPPGLAVVGSIICALRGARHFIWEMDVYPDIVSDLKALPASSLLARALGWVFDQSREHAEGIIALGEEMKDRLISHGVAPEKIFVCHNWADGNDIVPQPFPQGPLTILYSGNFGRAHEAATIREIILRLRDDPRFRFVFAGGGSRRASLERLCRETGIGNVTFKDYAERDCLCASLAQGHIGLVTQLPETLGAVVPSKTYGIMAAGRPLLFIGPPGATPARLIGRHQCGWHIAPGDASGAVELLERLAGDPELMAAAGARARRAFEEHFDRPMGAARVAAVLGLRESRLSQLTSPLFRAVNESNTPL